METTAQLLGALYTTQHTLFRVWAPTAQQVSLIVYDSYYGKETARYMMQADTDGTYAYQIDGNCHLLTYNYCIDGRIVVDPYVKAVTVNGRRGVVADMSQTNPQQTFERMPAFTGQPIIYEVHIRDFTISPTTSTQAKGKYLGFVETGTTTATGFKTGIDYLSDLGVTHVQLLPIAQNATIDETEDEQSVYNWGYDPLNYNVPEGSFATDAYAPLQRIIELKTMIAKLHERGIRVVLDVVYNHVYKPLYHSLGRSVPDYFFRKLPDGSLSDGTGVGNDTASEKEMMRRYIIDSLVYWVNEYKVDGFRFDLMGIHDVTTMQLIRQKMDEIDPSILLYGEGWELNTPLASEEKATQANAAKLLGIGFFNDYFRNSVAGSDALEGGFITQKWYAESEVMHSILLSERPYQATHQMIQYTEAHDNLTLWDRLVQIYPDETHDVLQKRQFLATALCLLVPGIPFLHAGQEFFRTKQGVANSYNSPDTINAIDWQLAQNAQFFIEKVKKIIAFRQSEPLTQLQSAEEMKEHFYIEKADYEIIVFSYKKKNKQFCVIINAQVNQIHFPLPKGVKWRYWAGQRIENEVLAVPALEVAILETE